MQERETRFLDAHYLGVRDRHGFDVSLNMLCGLFDVPSAALLDFDAARPEVAAQATVGAFSGENLRRYERDFAAIDPAPPAFIRRPGGTAISTDRLLAEEKRKPGAFFSEFFRPLGLEECLGGTIASAQGRFAMVGLHRTPDRKPFDVADIAKLEALMPHLARALQLRSQTGQGTVEYVALILLVALVMAGVIAAMKGFKTDQGKDLGDAILGKIRSAVDKVEF